MHQDDLDKHIIAILPHLNSEFKNFKKKVNVFLTDLKGQILIEKQNADYLDISDQPKGYYLAFLTDMNGSLIKRIKVVKK
ncbi:MAG TPA: hypothetical protein PKZ75_03195 [Bacteroidia bacterium]|nr:hypothetical protein [Bacteroidia bacterium]